MAIPHPSLNILFRGLQPAKLGYGWPLSFSRSGVAMYPDAAGVLRQAASGVLRHAFDPPTGDYRGATSEEARTNICLQSQDFSTTWTASGGQTVTTNTDVAPDGTTTADTVDWSTTADTRRQNISVANDGTSYTNSIWLKAGTASYAALQLLLTNGTQKDGYARINLTDGSVSANGTGFTATSQASPNGWWRVSVTAANNTSGNTTLRISVQPTTSSWAATTGSLKLWGAQVEAGATVTSYIPTTSGSVTRNADVITVSTSAFPYNASEGTLLARFRASVGLAANECVLQLSDAPGNNYISMFNKSGGGDLRGLVSGAADMAYGGATALASHAMALAYKANDFAFCVDGATPLTDASGSVPAGMDTLRIGSQIGFGNWLGGWVTQVAYWPRRLSNTDLQYLTL